MKLRVSVPRYRVGAMKFGDKVRVVGLPKDYLKAAPADTVMVFEASLGAEFTVEGFNEIGWIELSVPAASPKPTDDTIWVEPEYVELIEI